MSAMPAIPEQRLTHEEFMAWLQRQDGKFELVEGFVTPRFGWALDEIGRVVGMAGGTGRRGRGGEHLRRSSEQAGG